MEPNQRKTSIEQKFVEIFNQAPQLWSRAPGRVDLMGSHTDYNLGYVMTMTIDRDTWVAASPRSDGKVAVYSMNLDGGAEFSLDSIQRGPQMHWTDYVRGMAKVFQEAGYPLRGFNGLVHSTVPFSSGLSSSAALEMSTGVVMQAAGGFSVDPVQMALLGQKAENHFVGVNSGILDQYSSAMGKAGSAVLLDCRHLTSEITPIAEGLRVVICDTKAKRSLVGSEYGERRAQCEEGVRILQEFYPNIQALRDVTLEMFEQHRADLPEAVARRCRFIIEENQRVLDLAGALSGGKREELRRLYASSYAGARDLYEIGAPAMESMMQAMLSGPGVIGARQAGAGFGGCMVALVADGLVETFASHVQEHYQRSTGIEPVVYPVEPSPGAGLLP